MAGPRTLVEKVLPPPEMPRQLVVQTATVRPGRPRSGIGKGDAHRGEAQAGEEALQHLLGVRLGPLVEAAALGRVGDALLGHLIDALLLVGIVAERVADPVEQAALLG